LPDALAAARHESYEGWMWTRGWRDELLGRLDRPSEGTDEWDAIIVGGGITGAGLLAECARMGKSAVLFEARDFASGTSSRSTKLVHGGLRYLRQGQLRVTRESVVERERLLREAKGLVTPLGFYLATFAGDKMPSWMYGVGLAVYDVIARKWAHEKYTAEELLAQIPVLSGAAVRGGYHYFDAQTDDARLTLRVIREAVRRGGSAINYAPVKQLLRDQDGKVRGVVVTDAVTGRTFEVKSRRVVNATGVWVDGLRKEVGAPARMRAIRGSHLVFAREKLPVSEAVTLLHPADGRAVFAVPWEGVTILGTTDVDHAHGLDEEPATANDEASYLMDLATHAFPDVGLSSSDIRASWSGVRGVIDSGQKNPSKESRDHALWNEDGLVTVTGGKLTTFRLMALETLRAIGLYGERGPILDEPTEVELPESLGVAARARLLGRYGVEAPAVLAAHDDTSPIDDTPALWCELRYAARDEAVVHLEDLLLRRVRLGLLAANGGIHLLERIRAIVQPELGWDDARWKQEAESYEQLWHRAYGSEFA